MMIFLQMDIHPTKIY